MNCLNYELCKVSWDTNFYVNTEYVALLSDAFLWKYEIQINVGLQRIKNLYPFPTISLPCMLRIISTLHNQVTYREHLHTGWFEKQV